MIDIWRDWQRMMRAGTMWSETMTASQAVVGHRSRTIESAINDPFSADHAELGRMVSEKTKAFGAAGSSLARDALSMQADLTAQAAAVGAMMMGQVPTPRATQAMIGRAQRLGSATLASSIRALTPVHKAATANARRLGKRR
jgi:hypothetical protein